MKSELFATFCVGLALRSIISLNSYSGHKVAPMHGDYEAQRHWQEVTVNLNIKEWYTNTTDNDLLYWGLDYPPLTAYHSYLMGRVAKLIDPRFVELHSSRGFESREHKNFMRLTVLTADLLIYLPAILVMCVCLDQTFKSNIQIPLFIVLALYPGQILIDNGHFQYNNISLGLAAVAIAAVLRDKHCLAAFAFTLALNYKQMELYHSLPFFAFLFGSCLQQKSLSAFSVKLASIGAVVLSTFGLLWFPWMSSMEETKQVLYRLFPVGRGVFEDKVASVWCALNVVFKLKKHFLNQQMALICLASTLAAVLPTNFAILRRPSKMGFLLALFNTAAAFFLFSFQVHEKTVLLIALPAFCLFKWFPNEILLFFEVSVFSMVPLLTKDNLLEPAVICVFMFHLIFKCLNFETGKNFLKCFTKYSEILMLLVVVCSLFISAPSKYPDLWPLIISVISCAYFLLFLVWGNVQQFYYLRSKNSNPK